MKRWLALFSNSGRRLKEGWQKAAGLHDSWVQLRKTLSAQRRVTTSLRRKDGRMIHVRERTQAEPALMAIYRALRSNPAPGGTQKLIV